MNSEAHSDQYLETIAATGSRHVDRETATELLAARKELLKLREERDDLRRRLDAALDFQRQAVAERHEARSERDRALLERDSLQKRLDSAKAERDANLAEVERLRGELANEIIARRDQQERAGKAERERDLIKEIGNARERTITELCEQRRVLANELGTKQQECADLRKQLASLDRADATVRHLKLVAQGGEIYVHSTRDDGGTEVQRL